MKLVFSYIIESIFWISMVIISCLYMLRVSEGYLTIYTFGFFFLGVVIYSYLLRDNFKNNLNSFVVLIGKIILKFRKTIIIVVYPKEVFSVVRKVVKASNKIKMLFIKIYKKIVIKKKDVKEFDEENKEINNVNGSSIIYTSSEWMR